MQNERKIEDPILAWKNRSFKTNAANPMPKFLRRTDEVGRSRMHPIEHLPF